MVSTVGILILSKTKAFHPESFIADKSYNKALECFEMIISAPANALSVIVVNALKKAKLISLVARGEKYAFPK